MVFSAIMDVGSEMIGMSLSGEFIDDSTQREHKRNSLILTLNKGYDPSVYEAAMKAIWLWIDLINLILCFECLSVPPAKTCTRVTPMLHTESILLWHIYLCLTTIYYNFPHEVLTFSNKQNNSWLLKGLIDFDSLHRPSPIVL